MPFLRYVLMILALMAAGPAIAQPGETHIAAKLVAESNNPAAGKTVTLALSMSPAKSWHGYWANPGDAGLGPRFTWTLPKGASAGPAQFPVPQRLMIAGLMNYVYEGDFAYLFTVTLPAGIAPDTVLPIALEADWLACTAEICVPEKGSFDIALKVGDGAADPARAADFKRWRTALPKPLGSAGRFQIAGDMIRIAVDFPAGAPVAKPYFFPLTDGAIDYAAPQVARRDGDLLTIETRVGGSAASLKAIEGVLSLGDGMGLSLGAAPGAVPAGGAIVSSAAGASAPEADEGNMPAAIGIAFGFALLGGLLLNIMPCVFPILSLKALSLAKAGGDERTVRREALAYAAGVVLVCVALGIILLALRAGGAAAGWAFQLQDPRVIVLLLLLVSAIALNLAGLFELGTLSFGNRLTQHGGTAGAFWTGALAAFIATPCTGPFMGAALGAALVLPPAAAVLIFAGLGLGLALPFLLLGFVPALRRRLPKPGAWMDTFRRILSIPMFLTALGLAWILGRQAGVNGMTLGLAAALVLGFALWWLGIRQGKGRPGWFALMPALAIAALVMTAIPKQGAAAKPAEGGILASEPFSEQRLAALQAEGRPVFVYFTADWCLTCKVNEKTAIEREDVAAAFKAGRVAVLVGDWTDGNAEIGRFIETYNRSGVPLYLYFKPGAAPEVLPQVLTADRLKALAG